MSKKLGQHFLQNTEKLNIIARSLDIKDGDSLIEIGSGHGELTKILLDSDVNIFAVEKDSSFIGKLMNLSKANIKGKLVVIEGDILDELDKIVKKYFSSSEYKIVGNIPYYITGYLMRLIGNLKNKPLRSVFLVQKEVGEKICAGVEDNNLFSASIRFWADVKIIGAVNRVCFSPPPKVDSVIIRLDSNLGKYENQITADEYYRFIKIIFKQPRKTLRNNLLVGGYNNSDISLVFDKLKYNNKIRAHQLSIDDIIQLVTNIHS